MKKRNMKLVTVLTALTLVSGLPLSAGAADFTSPEAAETSGAAEMFSDGMETSDGSEEELLIENGADAEAAERMIQYPYKGIIYESAQNESERAVVGYDADIDNENIVVLGYEDLYPVRYMRSGCFKNLSGIKTLTIPETVISIAEDIVDSWEGITIICPKGSYASFFARKNGIPQDNNYEAEEEENVIIENGIIYRPINQWAVEVSGYTEELVGKETVTIPAKIDGRDVNRLPAGCFKGLNTVKVLDLEGYYWNEFSYYALDSWDGITMRVGVFSEPWKFAINHKLPFECRPYTTEYADFAENHIQYSFAEGDEALKAGGFYAEKDEYPVDVVVPTEIYGYPVTEIDVPYLYRTDDYHIYSMGIRNVYIPNSIKKMHNQTFAPAWSHGDDEDFDNLKSVIFEDGDLPLEMSPVQFMECYSLTHVEFPSRLHTLPRECFIKCPALKRLDLPTGMQQIDEKALAGAVNLEQLHLPSTITQIADDALKGLKTVTIYGEKGSYAEKYAREHKLAFLELGDEETLPLVKIGRPVIDEESFVPAEMRLGVSLKEEVANAEGYDFVLGSDIYFADRGKFLTTKLNMTAPKASFNMRKPGAGTFYVSCRAWKMSGAQKVYGPWAEPRKVIVAKKALISTKKPVVKSVKVTGNTVKVSMSATSYPEGIYGILNTHPSVIKNGKTVARDTSSTKVLTFTNVKKGTYYLYSRSFIGEYGEKVYGPWAKTKKIVVK